MTKRERAIRAARDEAERRGWVFDERLRPHMEDLASVIDAAMAIMAESTVDNGWQPIESAPVNPPGKFSGPSVLLWCAASETSVEGYYGQCASGDGGYLAMEDGREIPAATHWRPRLAPPAEETVQGREERHD